MEYPRVIQRLRRVTYDTYANFPTDNRRGDLAYATDQLVLYRWSGSAWQSIAIENSGEGHISILPHNYQSIGAGTWVWVVDTGVITNGRFTNEGANADLDNITYQVYLAVGTYTLRILTTKSNNWGIMDVDIDGVEVASFDLYSAAVLRNRVVSQAGITVAASGLKALKLRVDGKNGSSSAYIIGAYIISLWRTA